MTNYQDITSKPVWELAEFIYNVSNCATKITNCDRECAKCEFSDSYCISNIAEWLMEAHNE